jgi:PAS domain S-box-containing protein
MDIEHASNEIPAIPYSGAPSKDVLYRALVSSFPKCAVILFDQQLRHVIAGGSGIREMGLTSQMSAGKTVWDVFPAEICRVLEPKYRAALEGKDSEFELPYAGRIYEIHVLPLREDLGEVSYGMATIEDITENSHAGKTLVDSQNTNEQLIHAIDGIVWEGNAQTFEYYFVSKQAERLLGYPVERWVNEPTYWVDHIHPDDREWAVNFCALSTANKRDHVFEYRMIAADGRVVWLRDIVTVVVENNQPVKLLGIMVDITDKKKVEADLLEREDQYRSIFESVSDGLFINNVEESRLVDFNPAAAHMHGYTVEEFRQVRPFDFIHPESHNVFQEYIETVRSGGVFRGRAIDVRKDGSTFHVEVLGTSFTYKSMPHTLAVVRNIDEQVKSVQLLEERIGERTRELQTLLEVSRHLTSTLDVKAMLSLFIDQLKALVDFTSLAVWVQVNEDEYEYHGPPGMEMLPQRMRLPQKQVDFIQIYQREPLVVPDVRADTPLASSWREALHELMDAVPEYLSSWMGVPLMVNDRRIGHINFHHAQPGYYTDQHAQLALTVANHLAVALDNARLFASLQRGAEQFRAISELGQRITSILDVDELLAHTVHLIQETFGYFHVHVGLIEGDELVFSETAGVFEPEPVCTYCAALRLKVGRDGICGWVAGTGQPLIVPDLSLDPRYIRPLGATGSGVVVPLHLKGKVIGVLDVESREVNAFDERDVAVLQLLANQVAIAIENARLYQNRHELAALQERQKLARELHDSVSQALYGIGLGARAARKMLDLESFSSEDLVQPLEYVLSLAEAGLAEMRALIFELRPESLVEEGLVAALSKQAASLEARYSISIDVALGEEPGLSLEAKQTLYRIAQEAMNNIIKHANAKIVILRLNVDPPYVSLKVEDDGIGFDSNGAFPGHLGLRSMRERAERLGGKMVIESNPGRGTRVFAQLPL